MSEAETLDDAVRRDEADQLTSYRDRFVIDTDLMAYVDVNALDQRP